MKKILYISYDGMTDPLGQSQVLPYLVGLSQQGYEFTLLSFEKKERFEKSAELIRSICKQNNINWEPVFFTRKPPVLSKLYDNWKMKRVAARLHRQHNFFFTHCRSYVAASAGLSLKSKFKVPFLFDIRGFWVDERVDNGQWNLKNPLYKLAYKIYKKKEQKYFSESAHVISLTETGKQELVKNYNLAQEKVSVIPCCADLEHFDYKKISETDRKLTKVEMGIGENDLVLSYLGSLGGWYLTDEMLDFFQCLKTEHPTAKFLFITHDKREEIINKCIRKGISPEDIITAPATRQQVPLFLSVSNWSIFFIKDAYSKKASSPTKQGEIMAMGIPLVCNDIGDTGRIIEQSGAGVVIRDLNNETYANVSKNMDQLNKLEKEKIRRAAFDYYDLDKGIEIYSVVYKKID